MWAHLRNALLINCLFPGYQSFVLPISKSPLAHLLYQQDHCLYLSCLLAQRIQIQQTSFLSKNCKTQQGVKAFRAITL